MGWLLSVYIGAAVFGVGITLVDLFGLIGSHEGGADHDAGGHDGSVDHDIGAHDGGSDHDVGGHEGGSGDDGAAHGGGISHAGIVDYDSAAHGIGESTGHAGEDSAGEDSTSEPESDAPGGAGHHETSGQSDHDGSLAGHDRPERRSVLLSLLAVLRNLIYFCLGFGPVGWFALATSGSAVTSLLWSVPVGGAALLGTRALRRFMRRELNSAVSTSEVLMERGVVIVSIAPGELGKVRIKLGDLYVERFARAASAQASIRVGASVRVTDVADDCVYVEEE